MKEGALFHTLGSTTIHTYTLLSSLSITSKQIEISKPCSFTMLTSQDHFPPTQPTRSVLPKEIRRINQAICLVNGDDSISICIFTCNAHSFFQLVILVHAGTVALRALTFARTSAVGAVAGGREEGAETSRRSSFPL